jgi:hypothetical protein
MQPSQVVLHMYRLALYEGPSRVNISLPSPEDGQRFSFRNVVFSGYL